MRVFAAIGIPALAMVLGACSTPEMILTGKRLELRSDQAAGGHDLPVGDAVPAALALPARKVTDGWPHDGGDPSRRIAHPALGESLTLVWSADTGTGNGRRHRITADPVVADGRIFTIDSRSMVAATSESGAVLWRRDLTPDSDRADDASGGGLAVAGGRLYAATGFGILAALDPATGDSIWQQKLGAPASGAPAVRGGLVYAVSRDSVAWALDADNGRIRWQLRATPSPGGFAGGSGPAVTDRIAVFPFPSGEVIAVLRRGGVRIWAAAISGRRRGRAYANVTDIAAAPVVVDGVIHIGNQSGRTVALDAVSGSRLWTAEDGAHDTVQVAGGSVFMISDRNELLRLDAASGRRIWATPLPYYRRDRPHRRDAIHAHYGPVLAGGRLLVASGDGLLRSYDPATGALLDETGLPGGAATNMAVADRTLYVVSQRGQLLAFR